MADPDAYALRPDLEKMFGREVLDIVADRDRDGIADPAVIFAALEAAKAEIDAYLEQRYDLPLDAVPSILKQMNCDIALYRLALPVEFRTDEMRKRYEDAIKLLQAIVAGKAALPGAAEQDEGAQTGTTTIARILPIQRG